MRQLLIPITCILIISCGIPPKLVIPANYSSNVPETNNINNSEIGITLVTTEKGHMYKAIKMQKDVTVNPMYISKKIKKGDLFIHDTYTLKYELYKNPSDLTYGIAIPKSGGKVILYTKSGLGVKFVNTNATFDYSEILVPVPQKDYFKQEFIYNGRVGNALKFTYREFVDDLARPAFTQELQYDLSESNIIGFRGLRIEVINASNTKIEYKVLSYFTK